MIRFLTVGGACKKTLATGAARLTSTSHQAHDHGRDLVFPKLTVMTFSPLWWVITARCAHPCAWAALVELEKVRTIQPYGLFTAYRSAVAPE